MASEIVDLLCSPMKLERDRGATELQKHLLGCETQTVHELGSIFIGLLENESNAWETRNGALLGIKCLLPYTKNANLTQEFFEMVKRMAMQCLKDPEVRVRLEAGEVLGKLCQFYGIVVYVDCKDAVLELILNNLDRYIADDSALSQAQLAEKEKLVEKFSNSQKGADAEQIFHDTAGWKALETSMRALQAMIDGSGSQFEPWITQELLDLIFRTLMHSNRFVREVGFYVCSSLVSCGQTESREEEMGASTSVSALLSENSHILTYGHQFSRSLGIGLSDNWSQVRLAAAMATRKFLLSISKESREAFYPELLPKLCLNRYYLADGVRIYSQETWRQIAGTEGKNLVQKYIADVVKYYVSQTEANNHAVREASCACISELVVKIQREALQPFVPQLLHTLIECFQDDSWPVRDAACLASGNFVLAFPEESRNSLDDLYPLFFANLEDNIQTVRQGSAASLVNVVKAYGEEVLNVVVAKTKEGLLSIEKQPSESEKYSDLEKKPATFGVIKRLRDNDMDLHTNQTMYSCGSLAPKMGHVRSGNSWSDGCSRTFRRPSQPWELTDGCIYLVSELASIPEALPSMPALLELTAKAVSYRHFTHHVVVLETLCKQLPDMAKGMGKRMFKSHLELFLEPIFYSLNCENALTSSAASQCLNLLGSFLGESILRARVEQFDSRYLRDLEANLHIAPL